MDLEVFRKISESEFEQLAIVDTFNSLVVNRRFFSNNDFELKLPFSLENLMYFDIGNSIRINDVFYYVDRLAVDDLKAKQLVVNGNSFAGKLEDRVILENYNRQASPSVIGRDLINRHAVNPVNPDRKIHQIELAEEASLNMPSIRFTRSYGSLLDRIETLCETYEIGFRENVINPFVPSSQIEFYKGRDLTNIVEFTTDAENILNESFEKSDFDEKNVAFVAGEGEGADRKIVSLGKGVGLDRKELYVDARDVQQEDEDGNRMTDEEYIQALEERGGSNLNERTDVLLLDGEINMDSSLYEYRVDYDLGDVVKRSSPDFKLAYDAQITEFQEIYENGLQVVATFGKRSPTIIDLMKRM